MSAASPALVQAACGGDAQAVDALLLACQPDLRRFARRSCSTTQDAEDAVQAALWQLQRRIGTLGTVAAFGTWLFRIVERECFRLFRRQSRYRSVDADDDDGALDRLVAQAVPQDLRIDLARAIASLPAPYRTVLVLRDVEELTAPEAADLLGISLPAVKSRLHRARGMVRERLLAGGYLGGGAG